MSVIEEPAPKTVKTEPGTEIRWFTFVRELMPWQFHWLLKSGREIELHDDYISGAKTLDKAYAEIITETQHMEPK